MRAHTERADLGAEGAVAAALDECARRLAENREVGLEKIRALAREVRPRGVSVIDARPPHTETGLAGRPLHGEPPKMRKGLDPAVVAERLVLAIEQDERDVPASAFTP